MWITDVTFLPTTPLVCKATVIAIGGGGGAIQQSYIGGGGGSGYVQSVVFDIFSTEYQVSVGKYGHESFAKKKYGPRIITAKQGGNGGRYTGGRGYSGGGYRHEGGSDGSNGKGSSGGNGMGLDISSISLKYHILSPGNSGEGYSYAFGRGYGGGGGGVLVNNNGPKSGTYQGEGYGGGGSVYVGHGLQGMVLIEVKPIFENIIP